MFRFLGFGFGSGETCQKHEKFSSPARGMKQEGHRTRGQGASMGRETESRACVCVCVCVCGSAKSFLAREGQRKGGDRVRVRATSGSCLLQKTRHTYTRDAVV